MDLHSSYPFWMIKEGVINSFPKLRQNAHAEVVVIGGGITGALIADCMAKEGLEVMVVEKRHIAHGSTSASTSMLQYEIDVPLFELTDRIGTKNAQRAYHLCADAIDEIGEIASKYADKADFEKHPSLFFASFDHHLADILAPEFKARKKAGFVVDMLTSKEVQHRFGFQTPGAIYSEQGGQVNPYKLCHHLLGNLVKNGGRVYNSTEIASIEETKDKKPLLRTTDGFEIKAKHVVVACGYESQKYLSIPVTIFNSSYAIVSTPLADKEPWEKSALLWETKTPYLYMRTTGDNRILVGGHDERGANPVHRDNLIPYKKLLLEQDFARMFPEIPFETDFAWAGIFGETADGLPYIGSYDKPNVHFAMCYGGNGITFSVVAARLLTDAVQGKKNPDAALFSLKRAPKTLKPDAW